MCILVNGQVREHDKALTLAELPEVLLVEPRRVAIEPNKLIVPRARYAATQLADEDKLEIVTLVGGG